MPAVCFYFQVHQPFRVRRLRHADVGQSQSYFDDIRNAEIMKKVAHKCYLPTNAVLLELIEKFKGRFRVSFSITGVAIEQMQKYAPEVLKSFKKLAATGCVEFLGETYYHSLAALYDKSEFEEQVALHTALMQKHFNQTPVIFRNTELIYNDHIGALVDKMGFKACIVEGADDILKWRSPNFIYHHPSNHLKLLTKNYKLSDDIAFRFSNRSWDQYPLRSETFASWVHAVSGMGDTVNLFMDYETFGEHQWEDTGIFNFLRQLPYEILRHPDWCFQTPSEVIDSFPARGELRFHRTVSWADLERDTTAWIGNNMQRSSLARIYAMGPGARKRNNATLLKTWRRLLTSDHFYYMCTKWFADQDVHTYFSPFQSPYLAFLGYMWALEDLNINILTQRQRVQRKRLHEQAELCL